ncbi:hypothetical protein HBN50_07190 [Halobacteriovorax sp. GB3]|uniref:N-acyl amino acid synthase FeeM domain-containing protein n=1 Tax=Halobacteriovorax sp. GB3 TaxID=2719615 RepID=UPI00235EDAE1|nr:hypothetical protein [Halobacteriovorax sp. GB3]MDD0852873.1 hypothetical protein [Halobacteriovorax sp. GB3]
MSVLINSNDDHLTSKPQSYYKDNEVYLMQSKEELETVFRFRYFVYIEQMDRQGLKHVDHERKMIIDEWDHLNPYILGVFKDNKMIGTVRLNKLEKGQDYPYEDLFNYSFINHLSQNNCCYTSKIITDKKSRVLSTTLKLMNEVYRYSLHEKITHSLLDCNDPILSFFSKYGFVKTRDANHPEFGNIHIMLLENFNERYLQSIRSPFFKILKEYQDIQSINIFNHQNTKEQINGKFNVQ